MHAGHSCHTVPMHAERVFPTCSSSTHGNLASLCGPARPCPLHAWLAAGACVSKAGWPKATPRRPGSPAGRAAGLGPAPPPSASAGRACALHDPETNMVRLTGLHATRLAAPGVSLAHKSLPRTVTASAAWQLESQAVESAPHRSTAFHRIDTDGPRVAELCRCFSAAIVSSAC